MEILAIIIAVLIIGFVIYKSKSSSSINTTSIDSQKDEILKQRPNSNIREN